MNAFMSESQQVFFLSAHTFIVLPAPSLPLSRPQSGCIVKSSCQEYEFAQSFVLRHDCVRVFFVDDAYSQGSVWYLYGPFDTACLLSFVSKNISFLFRTAEKATMKIKSFSRL